MDTRLLWACIVIPLIVSPPAKASYDFITLTDPNLTGFTLAAGIDDAGEVVGSYRDSVGSGTFTTLDFPADADRATHGFIYINGIYTVDDTIDDPNAVGLPNAFAVTQVFGINDSGDLVLRRPRESDR